MWMYRVDIDHEAAPICRLLNHRTKAPLDLNRFVPITSDRLGWVLLFKY